MISFVAIIVIIVSCALLTGYLCVSVLRSEQALITPAKPHFYLPNDFFVSLVLFTNFWMVLLVLLGSQELLPADRQIITVVAALLAPFLSWWRKKKAGSE